MPTQQKVSERVALAIAQASEWSGLSYEAEKAGVVETVEQRAANLLKPQDLYGTTHTYIVEGDPAGWSDSGEALASVFMEPLGGANDCYPPLDYYGDGMEVSIQASRRLGDIFIEYVNPAVALVWPV